MTPGNRKTIRFKDMPCPLCKGTDPVHFFEDKKRVYLQCRICNLVFVHRRYWLDFSEQKNEYDLHENHPSDSGYRRFLSRLAHPLLQKLDVNQKGLDFGCGPAPALSLLFREQGHDMDVYDPIYYDDQTVFTRTFDFICATEVMEHLQNPKQVFEQLFSMLIPGGWLGIMTKLVIDQNAFGNWHYRRDMTHICFYSRETFIYISRQYKAYIQFADKDVILLRKMNGPV